MSVSDEFKRRIESDRRTAAMLKAIDEGGGDALRRLGLSGFAEYAGRLSELMTDSVLDELDYSADFGALMAQVNTPARYAHHLVNEAGTAVQTALDEKNGVRLRAVQPPYNDGRTKGLSATRSPARPPNKANRLLRRGLARRSRTRATSS